MASVRRSARRVAQGVLWGLTAVHVAEAVMLRKRRNLLAALTDAGAAPPARDLAAKVDVIAVAGSRAGRRHRGAAARAEMDACGAQVVDLVPGDLPAERALRLLRRVEPDRLGTDPFYTPGGAHEVVVVDPRSRPAWRAVPPRTRRSTGRPWCGPRCGPSATPRPRRSPASPPASGPRPPTAPIGWRELEQRTAYSRPYGNLHPLLLAAETAHLAAMTAGLAVAPVAAAAALLSWSAQPRLVFGGSPGGASGHLRPPGAAHGSVARLPRAWAENVAHRHRRLADHPGAGGRAPVRAAAGAAAGRALFEPRRATCYWCGGTSARSPARRRPTCSSTSPASFHLDECAECGHVFQNPALTVEGLDYYYADAYDGLGEELAETSFAALGKIYATGSTPWPASPSPGPGSTSAPATPTSCWRPAQRWPDAAFDALDMSDAVEEAARRGRVDTAYRGMFPDMAASLPRSYDVVSMHHYLEHTRDPKRELAAVLDVLEPGGHLMIEVPDAEAPWSVPAGPVLVAVGPAPAPALHDLPTTWSPHLGGAGLRGPVGGAGAGHDGRRAVQRRRARPPAARCAALTCRGCRPRRWRTGPAGWRCTGPWCRRCW